MCRGSPTAPATPAEKTPLPPWLVIESEGVGVLRLGTSYDQLTRVGIEWAGSGPIIDGLFRSWSCGRPIGYRYGGITACFTSDDSGSTVLDFMSMTKPYAGTTQHGIGVGTHGSEIESLLSASPDYFLPDHGVVCLGKRELYLLMDRYNRIVSMALSSFIDDPNHVCPEHRFDRSHSDSSPE